MTKFTKTALIAGLVFLIYGYLSRQLNIYFFWESKELGWVTLFVALTAYLFQLLKQRKLQKKKTIWIKFGIGFLLFGFAISTVVIIIFLNSEAYQTAIEYLKTDTEIKKEMGDINGFGIIPMGQIQSSTNNGIESGDAIFNITLKGNIKYKDIIIYLKKLPQTNWTVISIE